MSRVVDGNGWRLIEGDCLEVLPTLEAVDHLITDPPYSARTHANVKGSRLSASSMPDADDFACRGPDVRQIDLGFDHLRPHVRRGVAAHAARLVRRWVAVFSDDDSSAWWRISLVAAGLQHVRTAFWDRVACLRLGRRFVGIERDAEIFDTACERLAAEERGSSIAASRAGQQALFGGGGSR